MIETHKTQKDFLKKILFWWILLTLPWDLRKEPRNQEEQTIMSEWNKRSHLENFFAQVFLLALETPKDLLKSYSWELVSIYLGESSYFYLYS